MGELERHARACDAFAQVARAVPDADWSNPSPCPEWDAAAIVEHLIGFHEVLILRPAAVKVSRPPRDRPAERWNVTAAAIVATLRADDFDRNLVAALTTDVVVHTWDLARSTGVAAAVDADLCTIPADFPRNEMIGPAFTAPADADALTKLAAFYGRDPAWSPPARGVGRASI